VTTVENWNVPKLTEAVKEITGNLYVDISYADSQGKYCSRAESENYLTVGVMSDNVGVIERLKELPGFLKFSRLRNADGNVVARALFTREQRFHN
jgi:hypothetical protein